MTNTPPEGPGDHHGQQAHGFPQQGYPQPPGNPQYGQQYPAHQQQAHQHPGYPYPPQQGPKRQQGRKRRTGLIVGGSLLGAAVVAGGTIGLLGLAGVFSDETQEPLSESQIQQLLLDEDDFPFSGSFNEWESGTGGWIPTDVQGWTGWFPSEDDVEGYYEEDAEEEEDTDWGACLESMTSFHDADPVAEAEWSVSVEDGEKHAIVGISALEETPDFGGLWDDVISACEGEFVDDDGEARQEVVRLNESGFEGITITHEEEDFSSAVASMDHGENLVWVATMDMDAEEIEGLLEAQRDKLREGLDD